jgi:membrane protein
MAAIVKPSSMSWSQVFRRTLKEADQDDILGRAAQLSYYFFLSLFPLLICILTLLGVFSNAGLHIRHELFLFVGRVLPGSASQLIAKTLTEITGTHSGSKLSLGILFSLWSASAGMSAVMDTLNAAYEVKETRSFWRRNLVAIVLTLALAVLILTAVTILLVAVPSAKAFLGGMMVVLLKVVQWPAAICLVLLAFSLIYYFGPDVTEQHWHWVTPGAIAGMVLWLVASAGLKIYLHFFDTYGNTYGSLGAVIVLLLWFYLSGVAILLGAEINSVLEDAAAKAGAPDAKEKGEKAPGQPSPSRA